MRTLFNQLTGHRALGSGMVATATILLLAVLPVAAADTPYTATGWVNGVVAPGIACTNTLGGVFVRGNVHTARVQSSDPRLAGSRLILVNGDHQTDGRANLQGTVYHQVGTWDPDGTNFTASGGLWDISYRGVMQTDNSLQLHLVGSGSGGTIDGLRVEETLTRAAASGPLDPTVPYLSTGTIKPAPDNTSVVLDNFNDNKLIGWNQYGSGSPVETNHQLTLRADFPGVVTKYIHSSFFMVAKDGSDFGLVPNKTKEIRVALAKLDEQATNFAGLGFGSGSGIYVFHKGRYGVALTKWLAPLDEFALFYYEKALVRNTNIILSLALTRAQTNVILTGRVLDQENSDTVLYERTFVDTPQADPALTSAEFEALSGLRLRFVPDVKAPPYTSGDNVGLLLWQYTDGQQPAAEATFDNLELRTYEVPLVGIERVVRLSWPASATIHYAVEGAPTVQGPWLPVQEPVTPGLNQMAVPANALIQYFRLRQAP
ncbi:MAG: hypothetical protein AB9869_12500 [Verrucomicrobiia bacterium]